MLNNEKIKELYNLYSREIMIYIYKIIGSQENAEDILHDSFVNLMKYSKDHKIDEKTIRAFLYKTAHNLSINFIKKNSRIQLTSIEERDIHVEEGIGTDLELEELNNKIFELLDNFDSVSRSMFILKKESNLSNKEIAKITGKSERTVRRKLGRIIDYLEIELKKTGLI